MLLVIFQRIAIPRMGFITNIKGFHKLLTFENPERNIASISSRMFSNNDRTIISFPKKILLDVKPHRKMFTYSRLLYSDKGIQENISALHMKKRPIRKKRSAAEDEEISMPGFWNVKSLATAEEYDLEKLTEGLIKQDLYLPNKICTSNKWLYSLDFDDHGNKAIEMGIENPNRFVLKPQREGGGNNVYGLDVREALELMKDKQERTAWILMDRIHPPLQLNYQIRPGSDTDTELKEVVSELGIFGVIIGDAKSITINRQVGHMLRTKLASANEGGVASGLGACDSPYLTD